MRLYSSSVMPCEATSSGVICMRGKIAPEKRTADGGQRTAEAKRRGFAVRCPLSAIRCPKLPRGGGRAGGVACGEEGFELQLLVRVQQRFDLLVHRVVRGLDL